MENETGAAAAIRGFARWAITPPQSYAVYLVCLFLVAGLSFYAGTLNEEGGRYGAAADIRAAIASQFDC